MSPTLTHRALTQDRDHLVATDPSALAAWSTQFPCLSQATTFAELITLAQGGDSYTAEGRRSNEVLWSLLCLADHDLGAARVVLHAMDGLIHASARRCALRFASHDDALSAAVEAMWDTIRHFPTHRRREAAFANLRGDFLKRLCGKWSDPELEDPSCHFFDSSTLELIAPPAALDQDDIALEIVARAHDAGALSIQETRLLLAAYIDATSDADLAEQMGLSAAALRQRKSRATRHLLAWTSQNTSLL